VYVELKKDFTVDEVREVLAGAQGLTLQDDIDNQIYPMPLMLEKEDDIYVGRIRKDLHNPRGLNFWVVGDQIRKGAALNAVQIGESLLTN
jgi:aspartate-semialdehyde dehydrogenase